jgi:tRNA A37 N6-isopentenylltransferase MiaA
MKRHTRNYARRQLTWMRKLQGARILDITEVTPEAAAETIYQAWLAE